jgi:hypothetical protein
MKHLLRASVAFVAATGPAFAQPMIIRTPFGGIQVELPRQPIPRVASPQYSPQPQVRPGLQPSFDCTLARSFVAQTLCNDPDGPAADWELTAANWARQGTLNKGAADAFAKAETAWVHELEYRCQDANCVVDAYRRRAAQYRHDLHGLALAEARSSLDERIQIHEALFDKGFMKPRFPGYTSKPDGEFGPNTRAAIKDFQASIGEPRTGFLSEPQRSLLLEPPEITQIKAKNKLEFADKVASASNEVKACYEQDRPADADKSPFTDANTQRLMGVLSNCETKVAELHHQQKNKQDLEQKVASASNEVKACYEQDRPADADKSPFTDANTQRLMGVLSNCETKVAVEIAKAIRWERKIEEAHEKGILYANKSGGPWSISGQYNEMTDTTDYKVHSQQSNENGALAEVSGFCEDTGVTFTATLTSKDPDRPITFRRVGDGVVGQRRVNDDQATNWAFSAREWSNRFQIVTLSFEHDDPISAETTWRILATFETSMGPIMIRVPTFDESIQRMIVECKRTMERTAARPHKLGS